MIPASLELNLNPMLRIADSLQFNVQSNARFLKSSETLALFIDARYKIWVDFKGLSISMITKPMLLIHLR